MKKINDTIYTKVIDICILAIQSGYIDDGSDGKMYGVLRDW
jgi:hypothetical protein